MATNKDLEAQNPEAPGGNKHCLQCGWIYPIPGHAPGCILEKTRVSVPVAESEAEKLPEPPAVPFPKPAQTEVKKEEV